MCVCCYAYLTCESSFLALSDLVLHNRSLAFVYKRLSAVIYRVCAYLQVYPEFTHSSLSAVTHGPLHASVLRPASQAGPMYEFAGVGKLVNSVLLSLIYEAFVSVCCTTLLSSERVGPAYVQARSSNPRGRACRPNGKGSGKEGILSDIVPVYLYCPAFSVSDSLGV